MSVRPRLRPHLPVATLAVALAVPSATLAQQRLCLTDTFEIDFEVPACDSGTTELAIPGNASGSWAGTIPDGTEPTADVVLENVRFCLEVPAETLTITAQVDTATWATWTLTGVDCRSGGPQTLTSVAPDSSAVPGTGTLTVVVQAGPGGATLSLGSDTANDALVFGATELPVELEAFAVVPDGSRTEIRWTTASEDDNAGFRVYRRDVRTGRTTVVGDRLIAGAGTTAEPHHYAVQDDLPSGAEVEYWLVSVELSGFESRLVGPTAR